MELLDRNLTKKYRELITFASTLFEESCKLSKDYLIKHRKELDLDLIASNLRPYWKEGGRVLHEELVKYKSLKTVKVFYNGKQINPELKSSAFLLSTATNDETLMRAYKDAVKYITFVDDWKAAYERLSLLTSQLGKLRDIYNLMPNIKTKIRIVQLSNDFESTSKRIINNELILGIRYHRHFQWMTFEKYEGWEHDYVIGDDWIVRPTPKAVHEATKFEGSHLQDLLETKGLITDGSNPFENLIDYRNKHRVQKKDEKQNEEDKKWLKDHFIFRYEDIFKVFDLQDDSSMSYDQLDPITKAKDRSMLIDEAKERWLRVYPDDDPEAIEEHSYNMLLFLNENRCKLTDNLYRATYKIITGEDKWDNSMLIREVRKEYKRWNHNHEDRKYEKCLMSMIVFGERAYKEKGDKYVTIGDLVKYYQYASENGEFPDYYLEQRTNEQKSKENVLGEVSAELQELLGIDFHEGMTDKVLDDLFWVKIGHNIKFTKEAKVKYYNDLVTYKKLRNK